jgi:ABC-type multidrug transport system fused ATPase/permease subunit
MRIVFAIILLFLVFAVIVGFLILLRQIGGDIAQFITMATGHNPDQSMQPDVVSLIGVALSFPLMLTRSLFKLRYACYVSCGMALLLIVNLSVVLYLQMQFVDSSVLTRCVKYLPGGFTDLLEALPLVAILFTPHFNMMDVFEQLKRPTPRRTFRTIVIAVSFLALFFLSLGFIGYFLSLTQQQQPMMVSMAPDNILQLLPGVDMMLLPARVALFVAILCTLPVYMVPCREILRGLFTHLREAFSLMCGEGGWQTDASRGAGQYSQWEEYAPLKNTNTRHGAAEQGQTGGGDSSNGAPQLQNPSAAAGRRNGEISRSSVGTINPLNDSQRERYQRQQQYQLNHQKIVDGEQQPGVCRAQWPALVDAALSLAVVSLAFFAAQEIPDRVSLVWRIAGCVAVLPVTVFIPSLFYLLLGRELGTRGDRYTSASLAIACLSAPLILLAAGWNVASIV